MRLLVERLRSSVKIKENDLYLLDNTVGFMVNSSREYMRNSAGERLQIIKNYKKILSDKFKVNINKMRNDLRKSDEYYDYVFGTGIGKDYYSLIWSVKSLKNIIETEKIKTKKLEIAPLLPRVERDGITKYGLYRAKRNKNPIVVAEFPFLSPKYLIVDGNHRLIYKNMKGEKYIDCYILKPAQHKKAMVSGLFRYLFDINAQIGSILYQYY